MEFDKSKIYTVLNADELKLGSKVYVADSLEALQSYVEDNDNAQICTIKRIMEKCYRGRFCVYEYEYTFALAYLVSEPEEKKLKWTDLKLGDVIRNKELPFIKHLITGIDEGAGQVFFCDSWTKSEELEEWEKVDYELEEYERRVEQ